MNFQNQQQTTNNRQPKLKVCGLTRLEQIQKLQNLEVDFLGFIFYEKSPRFVLNHLSLNEIKGISHRGKVGVFVNETIENIVEISEKAGLNFIQLHGDESVDFILNLKQKLNKKIEIIKVIRIDNDIEKLKNDLSKISCLYSRVSNLLFDTDSKAFGGTGQAFDWELLNQLKIEKPYFLSGGISLESIHQLKNINSQPFALDINSKFEIETGIKDLEKIKKFIELYKV